MKRTPPPTSSSAASVAKRNLQNISPETPISKRHQQFANAEAGKISDMQVEDFKAMLERMFEPLATSAEIANLQHKVNELQTVNNALTSKVQTLTTKCAELEKQMESVYLWRNSGNIMMKLNRTRNKGEEDKERVFRTCVQLSGDSNVVDKSDIREIKTADRNKITFKVITGSTDKVTRMLKNSASLRGTDISVSKDYPKQIREQQQNLLKVRRFMMRNSNAKPKVRGNVLVDGDVRLTWSSDEGVVSSTGESLCSVLQRYGKTIEDLQQFLSQQQNNTLREEGNNRKNQSGMA
jgi:hypothetical protein